jgi:hypothetical protein
MRSKVGHPNHERHKENEADSFHMTAFKKESNLRLTSRDGVLMVHRRVLRLAARTLRDGEFSRAIDSWDSAAFYPPR